MGYEPVTVVAASDMSGISQFVAIDLSTGTVAATGAAACGILQNRPKLGEMATLFYSGESEAKAAGTITKGARLTVTTSGCFTVVASGGYSVGRALAACASGGLVRGVFNFATGGVTGA